MKKSYASFLSLLVGVMPFVTSAALPYSNSFETADYDGQSIFSNSAYNTTWSGGGVVAVITNVDYTNNLNTAYMSTPMEGVSSRVLAFADGSLTNEVPDPSATLVSLDAMIMPTFSQELTSDAALSNSQFAIAFTTNRTLALYHGTYNDLSDYAPDGQGWTVFDGGTVVSSGKWARITATINYASAINGSPDYYVMLKVAVDGVEQTDPSGYSSADVVATNGGPWFIAATYPAQTYFSRMVMSGSGMMDNLVINPSAASDYVTPTNHIPYGWMTFMGAVTNGAPSSEINAAEFADADEDGMLNWQEYVAGTHPTNSNSKLIIISQSIIGGVPIIRWLSSTAALAPYRVDSSTNLVDGPWNNEVAGITSDASGTNELSLAATSNSPSFFRVQIIK